MLTDGGGVKPVARLHVDERFKRLTPVFRPLHLPELPDPLRRSPAMKLAVFGSLPSVITWIGASAFARAILAKSTGMTDQPANFSGLHLLDQRSAWLSLMVASM